MERTQQLTTFDFNSNSIRVIDIDGEPWFVATDVCAALSMYVNSAGKPNVTMALKKLKPHQIGVNQIETKARSGSTRQQGVKIVSEGGLYKLIMRSDKAEADAFQDWVTEVVLPAIRKDGGYVMGEEKVETEADIIALSLRTLEMLRKNVAEEAERLHQSDCS